MKVQKIICFVITICMLLSAFTACTEKEHEHEFGAWQITLAARCTTEGTEIRTCLTCDACQMRSLAPTGHSFGAWVEGEDSSYHACASCGYREFQYHNANSNQNQGANGLPSVNPILAEYPNFDTFLGDCKSVDPHEILYNGNSNSFEVNFSDGTYNCDYYTVHIPSRVSDVKFSSSINGNPIQNLKLVIDDRTTGINITFENILIESTETILESQTRNIDVTVYMQGSKCSFEIAKAADGQDGSNKTDFTEAEGGQDGQNGTSAMLINGNCHFVCSAQSVIIKGGDGGNGGNGGTVLAPHFGHGGWGGNGGKGANAITGETLASVTVINNANVSIAGGLGGKGGNGGKRRGTGLFDLAKDGDPGDPGNDGTSGCKSFIYQ